MKSLQIKYTVKNPFRGHQRSYSRKGEGSAAVTSQAEQRSEVMGDVSDPLTAESHRGRINGYDTDPSGHENLINHTKTLMWHTDW